MNLPSLPRVVSIAVAFSIVVLNANTGRAVGADSRPNIVIIMSDDSGFTDLGCYGGEIETPNIDRLAEQGMRLSAFYTNGRCSPTRASLLSGLESARVGFGGGSLGEPWREVNAPAHRGRLPYDKPLLPELLKEHGYHTMMAGKWHLGGSLMKIVPELRQQWKEWHPGWELTEEEIEADFAALPAQRGFDEFFGTLAAEGHFFITPQNGHHYYDGNVKAQLAFDRQYKMHCYSRGEGDYETLNHGKTAKAFYDTDGLTDRAIDMINGASGNSKPPFLMYLAYRAPHVPLQAPDELVQKYLPRYADLQQVESRRNTRVVEEKLFPAGAGIRTLGESGGREDLQLKMAVHAAMMEKVDDNVGRVIQTLERSGELDNTLVLYFSDNGAASHMMEVPNTPYRGTKALIWEGGTKSHFIAVWPGKIKPGTISHAVTWVGDVLPTCLEIAGASYPKTFRGKPTSPPDGRSMFPVFQSVKTTPRDTLFFNDKGQQSVIYQGRWKLLIEPGWYMQTIQNEGVVYELYDLENDPAETNNLAEAKSELVAELKKKCEQWQDERGIWDYSKILDVRPNDFR
jgi:arylsulfatase